MIKGWNAKWLKKGDYNIDLSGSIDIVYYLSEYYPTNFFNESKPPVDDTYISKFHWRIIRLKQLKEKGWFKVFPSEYEFSPINFRPMVQSRFDKIDKNGEKWTVLTIPGHSQTSGDNSLDLLIKTFKKYNNIENKKGILLRNHEVPQKSTSNIRDQKEEYNSYKICSGEDISSKNIILLDDILTSGTSMSSAKKFLLDNGANKVICFALAKTHDSMDDYFFGGKITT